MGTMNDGNSNNAMTTPETGHQNSDGEFVAIASASGMEFHAADATFFDSTFARR